MNKIIVFFSLLLISTISAQIVQITICSDLRNMKTKNATIIYQLKNDIDCNNVEFNVIGNSSSSGQFTGTLDGKGFSIFNIFINSTSNDNTGIFSCGNGSKASNLTLKNFLVISTSTNTATGSLFGECSNCIISNINMTTASPSLINNITSTASVYAGGIVGYVSSVSGPTTISNCFISNTVVTLSLGDSQVGGMVGLCECCNITNCHNFGVISNSSAVIVCGLNLQGISKDIAVGGIAGGTYAGSITKSGVTQGVIKGPFGVVGGVVGYARNTGYISQLYVRSAVQLVGSVGGIIGQLDLDLEGSFSMDNCYSKATLTGAGGGLIGRISIYNNNQANLTISNSYSSSILQNTSSDINSFGNIIGCFTNFTLINVFSFSKVYFNNQSNSFPAIGSSSLNTTDNSVAQGFSSSNLLNQINSTFDECSIWSSDNLRIEPNINLQNPIDCAPTNPPAPTTQLPSTNSPTSNPSSQSTTVQFYSDLNCNNTFGKVTFNTNNCYQIPSSISNQLSLFSIQLNSIGSSQFNFIGFTSSNCLNGTTIGTVRIDNSCRQSQVTTPSFSYKVGSNGFISSSFSILIFLISIIFSSLF